MAATRNLQLTHIYASDLQRAWITADELRNGQLGHFKDDAALPDIVKLELLREQDFGSLEMTPWASKQAFDAHDARTEATFRHKETVEAMRIRADQFLDDFISPLWALAGDSQDQCVAVVSHGLFLSCLWKALTDRFEARSIRLSPEISQDRPLISLAWWSNTGYMELEIKADLADSTASVVLLEHSAIRLPEGSPPLSTLTLKVITVNGQDHLLNLKRTRGGVGSAAHDTRQKQIDGFFKRPKPDDGALTG